MLILAEMKIKDEFRAGYHSVTVGSFLMGLWSGRILLSGFRVCSEVTAAVQCFFVLFCFCSAHYIFQQLSWTESRACCHHRRHGNQYRNKFPTVNPMSRSNGDLFKAVRIRK